MNRKIILYMTLLALSSPVFFVGCTSSDELGETEQASIDDGVDSEELAEDGELAPSEDEVASMEETPAEGVPPEAAPADGELGDDIVADLGDDPTADGEQPLPDQALGDEQPLDIADNNASEELAPPMEDVPPPAESMDAGTDFAPAPIMEEPPPRPRLVSLKKIKDAPFNSNGRILNTVYVARKGDTLDGVAKKLFGDVSRKKELRADNSFLRRGVREGDKIYYNSPKRPDDTTAMMTYYEDNGIPSQTYATQDGDDLKRVAEELLGSRDAWKELWATNPELESKGALESGIEIRYWSSAAVPTMAANEPPSAELPLAAGTTDTLPPPPNDLLPPPPAEPSDMAALPPPPAPPADMAANDLPPPPPPPPVGGVKKPAQSPDMFQDQETTMALGAGAIILLSVIMIIVLRVRKSRAQRMRLGQTQV